MSVDLKKLENRLGVPVVGTSARSNVGMEELYRAIKEMAANRAEALESKNRRDNAGRDMQRGYRIRG